MGSMKTSHGDISSTASVRKCQLVSRYKSSRLGSFGDCLRWQRVQTRSPTEPSVQSHDTRQYHLVEYPYFISSSSSFWNPVNFVPSLRMASVVFLLGLMVYIGCEKIHDRRKRKRALKAEAALEDNLLNEVSTIGGTSVGFSLADNPPPYRKGTPPPPYRLVEQRPLFRLKKRGGQNKRMIA